MPEASWTLFSIMLLMMITFGTSTPSMTGSTPGEATAWAKNRGKSGAVGMRLGTHEQIKIYNNETEFYGEGRIPTSECDDAYHAAFSFAI